MFIQHPTIEQLRLVEHPNDPNGYVMHFGAEPDLDQGMDDIYRGCLAVGGVLVVRDKEDAKNLWFVIPVLQEGSETVL